MRAREEAARGGLVILAAIYGDVDRVLEAPEEARAAADAAAAAEDADSGSAGGYGGWVRMPPREGQVADGASGEPAGSGWWLDVRVALQYAVAGGMLKLGSRSKSAIHGFSPPPQLATAEGAATGSAAAGTRTGAPGRVAGGPCKLWVRYRIGDEVRTACVKDEEALQLGPA